MRLNRATLVIAAVLAAVALAAPLRADVYWGGFVQGLYDARLNEDNPTATEWPASETRLQLRLENYGTRGEVFGRVDFFHDGSDTVEYDWELREAYLKFRLGSNIDVKAGRQILTWGTGDLIFINDVFAKDYRSFFIGRDQQYLKAPQDALRMEWYPTFGSLNLVVMPRFEANRLPTGRRLSYYNPFVGQIVGEGYYFDPPEPDPNIDNTEIAAKFQRRVGPFAVDAYFYRGFYKNPLGAVMTADGPMAVYPRLNLYGASMRGATMGGILWLEGGYYDSREDTDGDNPLMPNSSIAGLIGYEKQVATNLTVNGQWQVDVIMDYDKYRDGQLGMNAYVRDEVRHLLTTRIRKLLMSELLTLETFLFYSPTDEDGYLRLLAEYKYTDEVTLSVGANLFEGRHEATEFGQFRLNDNAYVKLTYGF
jgi:hypothetical protein